MSASALSRLARGVATVGGLGRFPVAPGTAGALVGAALVWMAPMHAAAQLGLMLVVSVAGGWAAGRVARQEGQADPAIVVVDEVAGMLVAGFVLPKRPALLLAAFLLFRLFDIRKWFPMRQLERLPGGWGIMADDLAAGLLSRLLLLLWPA